MDGSEHPLIPLPCLLKQLFCLLSQACGVKEGAVLDKGIQLTICFPKRFSGIQIAQLNIFAGKLPIEF